MLTDGQVTGMAKLHKCFKLISDFNPKFVTPQYSFCFKLEGHDGKCEIKDCNQTLYRFADCIPLISELSKDKQRLLDEIKKLQRIISA
jgi:hypothetical protein